LQGRLYDSPKGFFLRLQWISGHSSFGVLFISIVARMQSCQSIPLFLLALELLRLQE